MKAVSTISLFTLAAAICAAPAGLGAAGDAAATLSVSRRDAVDEALARNPAITAAREQVEQALARVAEAVAFPDPSFAGTFEQQQSFLKPHTATQRDIGVQLTLPFPYKFHLRGEVAESSLSAAKLSLEQLRQQISSQTAAAYDALLVAVRHGNDLREGKALSESFLKKTEARFEAGAVARFDVIKAKVDLAQAENSLIANERVVAVSRAALNRLLGRIIGAPIEATDSLEVPPPLAELEALELLAESRRPEILSLSEQRKGAEAATTLAREYWLPDVNLNLFRNFTEGSPPAFSSAISFNVPILFWQHENGEVAEARHHELELAAGYTDLVAQVHLDVRTAYASATTALRQAVYIRDQLLPEAREAYRIASVSYELGGSSALELLDAKRTLLDAESQYADALGAANDARADLERAVGAPLPPGPSGAPHEP